MEKNGRRTSEEDRYEELIRKHRRFYEDLESGRRVPESAEQKHFIRVCEGLEEPETEHEKAYVWWKTPRPGADQEPQQSLHDRMGSLSAHEDRLESLGLPRGGNRGAEEWDEYDFQKCK